MRLRSDSAFRVSDGTWGLVSSVSYFIGEEEFISPPVPRCFAAFDWRGTTKLHKHTSRVV